MKTLQKTPQFHEQQRLKELFQQLFNFQIWLEQATDRTDISRFEIEEITKTIDQLLTILMDRFYAEN